MSRGNASTPWQSTPSALQREAQTAVAIASAVMVAALAVGVSHVVVRLRERHRSHTISNQLLSQVFPTGLK
ncbi:MAG: hypothetical protein ACKVVP_21570 [Chloroflexota bacterium]